MHVIKQGPYQHIPRQRGVARRRLAALLVSLSPILYGCDMFGGDEGVGEDVEDLTINVEADKSRIFEEEKALREKRESVQAERERLAKEREAIEGKLASLSQQDKSQREQLIAEQQRLSDEESKLRGQVEAFQAERENLAAEKSALLERIATLTANKGGLTVEQREQRIASREKDVAAREAAVAERERLVAEREKQAGETLAGLSTVLDELKAGAGAPRTVVVNTPAPSGGGGGASKTQALRQQKQALTKMGAKGILLDDLPPTARALNTTGSGAINSKDYDTAVAAFGELEKFIDGIRIDRNFVEAKFMRLSKDASAKKLDAGKQKKVQGLLVEVNESFNDGRFDRANRKANQIAALLRGK